MPTLDESFPAILEALADRYGRAVPDDSPDDPFEAILFAALTRSVEPRKARSALVGLRDAGWLEPAALAGAEPIEVAETLKQLGTPLTPQALRPLQRLARWLVEQHEGTPARLGEAATDQAREQLLGLNGIGAATADTILLLGLGRPVYPIDRSSYRIAIRHGWLDPTADYEEARALFQRHDEDATELVRLSGWLTRVGKEFCRPSVAKCQRCPLQPFLPEGGPREPEA